MKTRIQQWIVAAAVALVLTRPVLAEEYWDINGDNAGATDNADGTAAGNWLGAPNWSSSSSGGSTHAWPGGAQYVYFSAGNNATGTFTVTLSGSDVNVNNLQVQEGKVTLAGTGTIRYNNAANSWWGASGNGTSLTISNAVLLAGGSSTQALQINNPGDNNSTTTTISGVISGTVGGIRANNGYTILTGLNDFDAPVSLIYSTRLLFNSIRNVNGGASALGAPTTVANGTVTFWDGNILIYTGAGDTTDRDIAFAGGDRTQLGYLPTLRHSGTGILTWNGSLSSVNTVIFQLEGAGTGIFGGNISNSTGVGKSLGLFKDGTGIWVLSGTNTYQGATYVQQGILRLGSATALSANSNVRFNGGVLELTPQSGDFTNSAGTGARQVQWENPWSSGGFSAFGGNRVVNLGGSGAMLTCGTNGFINGNVARSPLIFGTTVSDSQVDFQNPINLNGTQTIQVDDNPNTNTDVAVLSGTLSGGTFSKTGNGTLILTASNNIYQTWYNGLNVNGGVVRLAHTNALPGGTGKTGGTCPLYFYGGVVELTPQSGDFKRGLSHPSIPLPGDKVCWGTDGGGANNCNGGFSAYGGNRYVNIGGNATPDTLTWGAWTGFVGGTNALVFGSSTADSQIEFKNPINFNGRTATIRVDDNPYSTNDWALLSGVLSGTNTSGLLKTGTGKLVLGANETYAGATTVSNGTLAVNGTLTNTTLVTVNPLGTLGGTGTVGAVSLESGGTIAPGDNNAGTLTVASLTAASNSVLRSYVQDDGTSNPLKVNGILDVSNMRLVATGALPTSGKVVLAEGTSRTGEFQSVDVTGVSPAKSTVIYTATQVLLSGAPRGVVLMIQ